MARNKAKPKQPNPPREWPDSDSDDRPSASEEGTPERLGAVRLEVGKSQLDWGERRPESSESSASGSEDGEEDEDGEGRLKKRVVVSGEESDHRPKPEVEIIDLETDASPRPPARPSSGGLDDMFLSDPDSTPLEPSSSYTRAPRRPPRVPSPPQGRGDRRRRRERTPVTSSDDGESSEDPERIVASPPPYRRAPPVIHNRRRTGKRSMVEGRKRRKRARVDPDDDDEEEEEDPEALVKELEMDEPVVVESRLRERNKKTAHQLRLEALKRRKEAKSRGERYTSPIDADPSSSSEELIVERKPSATHPRRRGVDPDDEESEGAWTVEDEEAMEGFIDDADKEHEQDEISNLLPEQYQMARYQNLEYHFKVISQFLIHLIIRGPTYARERKKQYYRSSYDAISRKLQGQKDSLVTSSVWKPDFKKSLETYPEFVVCYLEEVEHGCDACHLTGRLSRFSGELRGRPYNRETFEDLEDDEPDSEESEDEEREDPVKPSRGPFKLGKFCRLRAEVFHEFSHWERSLYVSYKDAYGRLERRVRSGDASVRGLTNRSLRDPDEVVQWLDSQGHIMSQFERLSGFEFDLQKLS